MGSYRPVFTIAFLCLTCLGVYSFVHEYWSEFWSKNKRKLLSSNTTYQEDLTDEESASNDPIRDSILNFRQETASSTLIDDSSIENLIHNEQPTSLKKTNYLFGLLKKLANTVQDNEAKSSTKSKSKRQREHSDKYFIMLFWLFICVKLRVDLYIAVPILVIIWKLVKSGISYLSNFVRQISSVKCFLARSRRWFEHRRLALAPRPFFALV
jgi:hypothetical protein